MDPNTLVRVAPAPLATTPVDPGRLIESIVTRGDLSGLSPAERAKFYVQMCEGYGLNPASQPFAFLKLNGKEILYATRGATDQLAAIHKLDRKIIDGPKVIDLAGTKVVYAVAEARHPNGRTETSIATLPLVDPVNVLMKCETKAKRRVTLSILGMGLLDEQELETIPAHVQQPAPQVSRAEIAAAQETEPATAATEPDAESAESASERAAIVLGAICDRFERVTLPGEATVAWIAARPEVAALPSADREAAWKALCKKVEEVGKMKNAKVWLKKAIAEEDARRDSGTDPGPLDDPPAGGGGATGGGTSATPATGAPAKTTSSSAGPKAMLVPDWSRTEATTRTHVAGYTHPLAVEGGVRKYGYRLGASYLDLCAQRLHALSPADHHGATLTTDSARDLVLRWADEGVRAQSSARKRAAGR